MGVGGVSNGPKFLKVWWPHATLFYFLFFHIRYITEHGKVGSHHTTLYDEAGVFKWNCCYYTNHITYIVVMRLRKAGFWHGTGGLKVTVSSGNFGLSP